MCRRGHKTLLTHSLTHSLTPFPSFLSVFPFLFHLQLFPFFFRIPLPEIAAKFHPFPLLPSLPFPSLYSPFYSPLPSPEIQLWGLGERCKLPQRPQTHFDASTVSKHNLVHGSNFQLPPTFPTTQNASFAPSVRLSYSYITYLSIVEYFQPEK